MKGFHISASKRYRAIMALLLTFYQSVINVICCLLERDQAITGIDQSVSQYFIHLYQVIVPFTVDLYIFKVG